MKKKNYLLVIVWFLSLVPAFTQLHIPSAARLPDSSCAVSVGLGSGINSYCGIIGGGVTIRLYNQFYIRTGVGVGSWGYKFSGMLLYRTINGKNKLNGWMIGAGYYYATGLSNIQTSLQVFDSNNNTETRNVSLTLLPTASINLSASYNWYFHNKNYFYFEFGYGLRLKLPPPYRMIGNSRLTGTSVQTIQMISPGGLVAAVGIMWGL